VQPFAAPPRLLAAVWRLLARKATERGCADHRPQREWRGWVRDRISVDRAARL